MDGMMNEMGAKELLDVVMKIGDRIEGYWGAFNVVNALIIGWLITMGKELPLRLPGKVIFCSGLAVYWSFTYVLVDLMKRSYAMLKAASADLKRSVALYETEFAQFLKTFEGARMSFRRARVIAFIIAAVISTLAVFVMLYAPRGVTGIIIKVVR